MMTLSAVILGSCLLAVASAQFYLPTNKAQRYVRPRLEQGKAEQKRDPAATAGHKSKQPNGQDRNEADQREALRQLLAAHGDFRIPDSQSAETQESVSGYQEKKQQLMCYLLLQIFDEKVGHILAEEEGDKKGTKEERQQSRQRAEEAIAFINKHLATLDYCSQYYGHD